MSPRKTLSRDEVKAVLEKQKQVRDQLVKIAQCSQGEERDITLNKLEGASQQIEKIVSLVFTLCSFVDY